MTPARKKTVLIADDHSLLAEGIAGFLSLEYEVVGIAPNGRRLVNDATRLRPDLVMLDISMPELNGTDAARQLHPISPSTKLIFVTQQTEPDCLRRAFGAGASTEEVIAGGTYISSLLEEKTAFAPVAELRRAGATWASELTTRQREVLQMVAEGRTSKEIGAAPGVSPKTVEFHKKALVDQTGLRTIAELTRYAVADGIVSPL